MGLVAEIERDLAALRGSDGNEAPHLRTSVMTHLAWVPERWFEAAHEVLAGLAERHPSRTIVLVPQPDAGRDVVESEVSQQCFPLAGSDRSVCTETIELRLLGATARRPASVVQPLLVSDLPVFCRWRGEPPWGADELEQLVAIVDRLVVDSGEWEGLPGAYGRLAELFEQTAVSDIAWTRTLEWRRALAASWPGIGQASELRVAGPEAEALLLAGWLRSRLGHEVALVHYDAERLELVAVDGEGVERPRVDVRTPSDLLSDELDRFSRDRIYESAVEAIAG